MLSDDPKWAVGAFSGVRIGPAGFVPEAGIEVARRLSTSLELFGQGSVTKDATVDLLVGARVRF